MASEGVTILQVRRYVFRHKGKAAAATWGLADQGVISAANFATMVVAARALGPASFGQFTLMYLILLFANSLQTALILQPHNVLGAQRRGDAYVDYTTSTAIAQMLFAASVCLLCLLAATVSFGIGASITPMLFALSVATPAWQLQEFVRRVFYTTGDLRSAFLNDIVSYGSQLVLLAGMWWVDRLSGPAILYTIGASSLIAAAWGMWHLRNYLRGRMSKAFVLENWQIGKWLSAANIMYLLASQAYFILTAAIVSVTATGYIRAAQNLVAPIYMMSTVFQSMATPRAAAAYTRGGMTDLASLLRMVTFLTFAPLVGYTILLAFFSKTIVDLVYGLRYGPENYGLLIALFAMSALLSHAGKALTVGLLALQATKAIFQGQVAAMVATMTVGVALIWRFDAVGTMWGLLMTQGVLVIALSRSFRQQMRTKSSHPMDQPTHAIVTSRGAFRDN